MPASGASSGLTYARARLLLGISGVGASVLVATALLAFDVPQRVLSTAGDQPLSQAVSSLALLLCMGALVFLPFDVIGGARIVRQRPSMMTFSQQWARGVAVQLAVWSASAAVLMYATRVGGAAAALAGFVLLQFLLAALRAPLARLIAAFDAAPLTARVRDMAQRAGIAPERLVLLETRDEGFVGGWSGIAPRTLLLPARWLQLPDEALVAALVRRRIIAESGAHLRGVVGAILWNTLGFIVVRALTGAELGAAAGMLTMAAGMTLWSFVGVLVLPTPSRVAVHAVDADAAREIGARPVVDAIERLDRWQDDEARRSAGVEAIFHPVPSRSARVARLAEVGGLEGDARAVRLWHAHQVARQALWLGWATFSPVSRLVHCNVGRPALWGMLPGD